MRVAFVLLVSGLVATGSVCCAVPRLLSYQGLLRAPDGAPVADGEYTVTFTVYADSLSPGVLWEERQTVRTVGGVFHVLLGAVDTIPPDLFTGDTWLGTAIGGGPELTPRVRMVSVAYAFEAINATRLDGATAADLEESAEIVSAVQAFGDSVTLSPFRNLFRSAMSFDGGGGEVAAFVVGPTANRYITGVYFSVSGAGLGTRTLQVKVNGAVVLKMATNGDTSGDAFWQSGGGAPLMIGAGGSVTLRPEGAGIYNVLRYLSRKLCLVWSYLRFESVFKHQVEFM